MRMIDEWRTIEEPESSGIGLPRDSVGTCKPIYPLKVVCMSKVSGGEGQQRDHAASAEWRTIGRPARRGIGPAREDTCEPSKPVWVDVGGEGRWLKD